LSSNVSDFANQLIGVIGAGATGLAAAPLLARLGARVRVFDAKPADLLGEAPARLEQCAELRLGDPHYSTIEECDLVVTSPGVPRHAPVLQEALRRGQPVLSEIEVAYRVARAPIVAVTGTNGKTTTVMMIAAILRAAGRDVRVAGNTLAGGVQTPLIEAAEAMPPNGWIVAEISSFQLEWVDRFRPRVAVVTNITADHLDRYRDAADYASAKARLLDAQEPGDAVVLNIDNAATRALADRARGRLLRFSRQPHEWEGCWVAGAGAGRCIRGRLDGVTRDLVQTAALRVPGEHNVENALAACAAAMPLAVEPDAMSLALSHFEGVADRLEYVTTVRGVDYINNTMCTNVDAAVRSIEACDRPVVLIAGGRDKGLDFDPLGCAIARHVKALVTIGADGCRIAEAARAHGFDRITAAATMGEAVRTAARLAGAGDIVLLSPACASFDWYPGFEARGADFKAEVRKLAAGLL
jgi:UDP-N-acetylmuramoylalanine--D-glutamate ligase